MKTLTIQDFEDGLWNIIWQDETETIFNSITSKELIKQIQYAKKNGYKITG